MDSTQLRLLILAGGILLILAIYLWDKRKQAHYQKRQQKAPAAAKPPPPARQEPSIDGISQQTEATADTIGFSVDEAPNTTIKDLVADLSFSAQNKAVDEAQGQVVPRLIIQLNIAAPEYQVYSGHAITEAAQAVELNYWDGVYQRISGEGEVMFYMASMLEPGTLPFDDETYTTRGLTLFSELPGACDGLAIYSDMLFTAERLLALLGGTLLDERRSVLTKQSIEHTREAIIKHRRQIQLLKKHEQQ